MCGIIGYIGEKKVSDVLVKGLSRLEYRGYDSAGIAVLNEDGISVFKEAGKLSQLKQMIHGVELTGHLGIAHTRWATHGEPSQRNAHPHTDCTETVAIVHNGIIENHEEIRASLIRQGHEFRSDTDSEVIAHLIEEYHVKKGMSLVQAVRVMLGQLEGSYALCAISQKDLNQFVAARNGSPLVVGVGRGENLVASDAPALLDHTRHVIFLDDHQMAVIKRDSVEIFDQHGKPVKHEVHRIDWDADEASKQGYDHFMLKEIEEQADMVERILRTRLRGELSEHLFDVLKFDQSEFNNVERIVIQGCGTSWHAALIGKFLFEALAGLPTEVDVSSEFRYRHLVYQPNTLVLSITQSGETIDTLMGVRRGKSQTYKTVSICNVLGSTIARESDGVIYTQAGPEIGVASTKAYLAQMTILILLSLYFGKTRNKISGSIYDEFVSELRTIPSKLKQVIQEKEKIREIALKYYEARDFLFLSRGINYPNAHEGALKIKEIGYIHATGHPAGEMKHGPIALIDEKMPVVCIAVRSSVYEKMISNIREVKARHGKVIAIATEGDSSIKSIVDDCVYIPACSEFLSPLLVAVPLQYLAYYVSVLRGNDVDQPRNLAKSVTVE
ncbi:MAG: glutamine--fructose-6-phosphate aminotransferase [Omnitrophica bacterium RIFCSPLOWO2_12_FULL_44_17]|uniref:Glutamine--fructose-6-phosphate aminotransferase [isomerizing] n=1 Tax=Candidatus Danuiimicrobium aquiferis TaxID=1801832 RepID=A0A1G1KSC0_9BACT|nr:MAG: glutamine--fructose-6-phosphate aminotransferase [Omnitrophica bacterium RIFCSPHIGHO2_02_FULL_45_28]OGW95449.1 MAG: glutamine--fructose-6-phosphate aminotransferase [Omnitrophica bacterium RIFCSPLOWO2_12_FULL_44_17]OGX03329.1 MAG: glutamine--fructose-6-phosphate aminotransferase [Omnitrophica bacterium RIFCSPLOWO2_02_FULL_44_11]